jgi:hypothetical protein
MITGVTKEMDLGGDKEVLEQLNQLDRLMMKEKRNSHEGKKLLATLNNCFPITEPANR